MSAPRRTEAGREREAYDAGRLAGFEEGLESAHCPACHHRDHDPGSCESCPRCELHTDDALAWVRRIEPSLIRAIEDEAARKERERIAFEVQALNHTVVMGGRGHGTIHEPTREAVLAAIIGEAS